MPFSVLVTMIVITGNEPNCDASESLSLAVSSVGPCPALPLLQSDEEAPCQPEKMKHSGEIKGCRGLRGWLYSFALGVLVSSLNGSWSICPKSNVAHSYATSFGLAKGNSQQRKEENSKKSNISYRILCAAGLRSLHVFVHIIFTPNK